MNMKRLLLHELISYVFEDYGSVYIYDHNVDMKRLLHHELILYVFEDYHYVYIHDHNVDIGMFDFYELTFWSLMFDVNV